MINEAIDDAESGDPHVDEKFIGRKIKVSGYIQSKKQRIFSVYEQYAGGKRRPKRGERVTDFFPVARCIYIGVTPSGIFGA